MYYLAVMSEIKGSDYRYNLTQLTDKSPKVNELSLVWTSKAHFKKGGKTCTNSLNWIFLELIWPMK